MPRTEESHSNHGYQHEDEYSDEYPTPINTHHSATAGQPHSIKALKAPLTAVRKRQCSWIIAIFILLLLVGTAVLIWFFLPSTCSLGRKCGENGVCISSSQWCDGKLDCFYGQDEADCPAIPCPQGRRCGENGECISSSLWCDGDKDCAGGEDEAHCIRLYGPDFLLQIFSNRDQKWKPVCSYGWGDEIGRDACSEIGYSRSDYVETGETRPGSGSSDGYMQREPGFYMGVPVHAQLTDSSSCSSNAAVTLKCIECGKSDARTRVVGGQDVTSSTRWPWQVRIQSTVVCGGSIITPSWIVTAAHCVDEPSQPEQWEVYAGYLNLKEMVVGKGSRVKQIISHPGYNSKTLDKDIALLKLKDRLTLSSSVRPVCLPNAGLSFTTHKEYFVTGWGRTRPEDENSASQRLQEARVSVFSRSECNSAKFYDGRITKSMICAGGPEGGVGTCQGDSGGPLVTKTGSLWWLVGDTSWGVKGCVAKNKPPVYGNVTYFLEWIYEQMQKNLT